MINLIFVFISTLFMPSTVDGGSAYSYTRQDSLIFEKYITDFGEKQDLPMGRLIAETALYFKGRPYVASTLEKENKEKLVINLREFDCTTLVETCIALSGTIRSKEHTFKKFRELLQMIRYRQGIVENYSSRLHYVSDWIYDNSEKGILTDVCKDAGSVLEKKLIDYMSTHPNAYRQLTGDRKMQHKMEEVEADINARGGYYYIPKQDVNKIDERISEGDIIAFATSIDGLDYSHIGIAYRGDHGLSFIHASTRSKTVTVEPQSLYDYCKKSSRCTGITVLRINE